MPHGPMFFRFLGGCGAAAGLFTSPHLVDIRERIRLDGLPISEEKYLRYFWAVWDALLATKVGGRNCTWGGAHVTEHLLGLALQSAR